VVQPKKNGVLNTWRLRRIKCGNKGNQVCAIHEYGWDFYRIRKGTLVHTAQGLGIYIGVQLET